MSIITISRGSYSRGKEVAEGVAEKLGYECISRDFIIEASGEFNVPEVKMVRAVHDAPSILERLGTSKKRYIAYFESAMLNKMKEDNKVYHGLAGHFFLQDISHVLKVRIISDMEDRVALEMAREGISAKEARRILKKDDEERRKWGMSLYGIDTNDPSLYDMVLHIRTVRVEDAVDVICHTVGLEHFQLTEESRKILADKALAASVKVKLIDEYSNAQVTADDGNVKVNIEGLAGQEDSIRKKVKELASDVPGVENLTVNVVYMDR